MNTPHHHLGEMIAAVLGSLFRKPATIRYPFAPFKMPDRFRGPPAWDSNRCIGCKLCMRDCPSQAITITKVGEKRFDQTVDLGKCVYCGQCADTCPRKVITLTSEFELAQVDKQTFKITYHAAPAAPAPEPAPSPEPEKSAGEPQA
jgi:formate hydrogenlyase subunit 6/NADH:ubiquinone oxidoreductase subunit I